MKRFLPLFILTGLLFGQDVLTHKSGEIYKGQYFGNVDRNIVFKVEGDKSTTKFAISDVSKIVTSNGELFSIKDGKIQKEINDKDILEFHEIESTSDTNSFVDDNNQGGYSFVDKYNYDTFAKDYGFDIDAPYKGLFTISINRKKITSDYAPIKISSDSLSLFHYVQPDSFAISNFAIDSLQSIQFDLDKTYLRSSFFIKYGYNLVFSILPHFIINKILNENFYLVDLGLNLAYSSFSILGISALTIPKQHSFVFKGSDYFKAKHKSSIGFGVSVGNIPSLGVHLSYYKPFSPVVRTLSVYHVPLQDERKRLNGILYKVDYGVLVYPNIKTPIIRKGPFSIDLSAGIVSKISFADSALSLYNNTDIGTSTYIYDGMIPRGEIEFLFHLSNFSLNITKTLLYFENTYQSSPFFIGINYYPNRSRKHTKFNLENIDPIIHKRYETGVRRMDRLENGLGVNINIPQTELSHVTFQVLYSTYKIDKNDPTYRYLNDLEKWSYAVKYSKYYKRINRFNFGFSSGLAAGALYDYFTVLLGPSLEFKISPKLSIFCSAEINVLRYGDDIFKLFQIFPVNPNTQDHHLFLNISFNKTL